MHLTCIQVMESSKNIFRQAVFYEHRCYECLKRARCYIVHIDAIHDDIWAEVLGQTVSTCSHCNGPLTTQRDRVTGRQRWRDEKGRQVNQQWFHGTPELSPGGGQRSTVHSHSQRFCSAVGATYRCLMDMICTYACMRVAGSALTYSAYLHV